tara:strand:+ start:190 stop:420 length:231 start_codon:yes stop_codon:yes gene_type:complete
MQSGRVHQNRAIASQQPTDHKFRDEHGLFLLTRGLSKLRPSLLCKTGLKIQCMSAKNAAPSIKRKGLAKGHPGVDR